MFHGNISFIPMTGSIVYKNVKRMIQYMQLPLVDKKLQLQKIFSVLQSLDKDAREELTPLKLRNKAAKFARATVKAQMASFKVVFNLPFYWHLFASFFTYKLELPLTENMSI